MGNLASISAALLNDKKFFGDLPKGPVEYRHVMLEPKAHIGVVVKGAVARGIPVGDAQCNGLVSVVLRHLYPAVEIAMRHIASPEDYKSGFEFFLIGNKRHRHTPLCRIRADRWAKSLICHICVGSVWGFIHVFVLYS